MDAQQFIEKWGPGGSAHALNEKAGAQLHFIDLCHVLGVPTPSDAENYCFERGLRKTGEGQGYADVWMRKHFAWEYKAPGKSLDGALRQLMMYALPLESPPLLVVSDRLRIEIHTHFTGTPSEKHVFELVDIRRPEVQERLRWLWTAPDRFLPRATTRDITEEAARTFAETADRLRQSGVPGEEVSHFLTQCLFCFFAEDVGLLPDRLFERLVGVKVDAARLSKQLQSLFETMRDGGFFGVVNVPWFNGGLFKVVKVPPLTTEDVAALRTASGLNWSAIDPSIFGTLFERGLDPSKRSQLGAHYTDPQTILRLVEPVVLRPLRAQWETHRAYVQERLALRDSLRAEAEKIPSTSPTLKKRYAQVRARAQVAHKDAQNRFNDFLGALHAVRVLDPACGSGNFLFLALKSLKDFEHRVNLEAEELGLQRQYDVTGPHNVLGIELNEYAAELARVTVWIGELQWRIQRGYGFKLNPVLEPLDHIECRDALLQGTSEAEWPAATMVVGNPPFVGDKKMRSELGDEYTELLRSVFKGRLPGGSDLVCYWFEKARAQIEAGKLQRAGLVATSSIRGGKNRDVLDRVCTTARIFEAWSEQPWVNEGAAVEVSLIAFAATDEQALLDGQPVDSVSSALTASTASAHASNTEHPFALAENADCAMQGPTKGGRFEVPGDVARQWLSAPNPHGRSNADVLLPWFNGASVTGRWGDEWIVDFTGLSEAEAAKYELPYAHVVEHVKPAKLAQARQSRRDRWWLFNEPAPTLRAAAKDLTRILVTPEVAKHRVWTWLATPVCADKNLVVVVRADDVTFGVLQSRFHTLWALRHGTSLEDRPRYTSTTTFRTYPFPPGLAPADTGGVLREVAPGVFIPARLKDGPSEHGAAIARAAAELNGLRERWLNPPEWTKSVRDFGTRGPGRPLPKPGFEASLSRRTLTELYNAAPDWLRNATAAVDKAVARAYGWNDYDERMTDEEILRRLLALNHQRSRPAAADSSVAAGRRRSRA